MNDLVEQYVAAYNRKDVAGMLALLHDDILFENVNNADGVLTVHGKAAFGEMAHKSAGQFSERMQIIRASIVNADSAAVEVDYHATLAKDLSDDRRAGDTLVLRGVSIFRFKDGKIAHLSDYS